MKEWFQARTQREKLLLNIVAIFIALFALYYGAYAPLDGLRKNARDDYDRAQATLQDVERGLRILRRDALSVDTAPPPDQLTQIISTSARERGLSILRIELADDALRVWFDQASAPGLFAWISYLEDERAISVTSATIDRNEDGGTVRAQLLLAPGGR